MGAKPLCVSSFLLVLLFSCVGLSADTRVRGFSCSNCPPPKFQGREFYLPFCSEDEDGNRRTHHNLCGAICFDKYSKGSCDGCESRCSAVFTPVCSADQERLYANPCHARRAGMEEEGVDFVDCQGINTVIPGKSKLPPNRSAGLDKWTALTGRKIPNRLFVLLFLSAQVSAEEAPRSRRRREGRRRNLVSSLYSFTRIQR